jgi:hypothetical protein
LNIGPAAQRRTQTLRRERVHLRTYLHELL